MRGPMLVCDIHGLQEDRFGVAMENSQNVTIDGGSAPCPICGRQATYVSGTYSVVGNQLSGVIRLTPSQAARLRNVLRWAQDAVTKDDAEQQKIADAIERGLRKDAPKVATLLDGFKSQTSASLAAWVSVLIALLMWMTSGNALTAEEVARIVDEQMRASQHETAREEPASSNTQEEQPPESEDPPRATEIPTPTTR